MLRMQEVSRSHVAGATAEACTLTCGRRLTGKCSQVNPKFPLNRRSPPGRSHGARGLTKFVALTRAYGSSALNGPEVLPGLFDLIGEFSAEFVTDPPCQPTLSWAAF